MKKSFKLCVLFAMVVFSLALLSSAAFAEGKWMVTKNTLNSAGRPSEDSILIWNPSYSEGESVEWFGGKEYSSSVGSFVAQGEGRANWYLNGVFEQSDEGNHFMGQRHGKIIQKFADGRTTVTYWNYGVKSN